MTFTQVRPPKDDAQTNFECCWFAVKARGAPSQRPVGPLRRR
jgi:hypothetical protein